MCRTSILSDVPVLNAVAVKCPLEYGTAVYDAQRILIDLGLNTDDDFEDNCSPAVIRSKDQNKESLAFYPNPGIQQFYATIDNFKSIELYNNIGNKIGSNNYNVGFESNVLSLDLKDLPSGLYFVNIDIGENKTLSAKLIKTN